MHFQASLVQENGARETNTTPVKKSPPKLFKAAIQSPLIKRPPNTAVTLQGWLLKQGSDGLHLWKKRWFVLSDLCLFYYKNANEDKQCGSILLPSYTVTKCQVDPKQGRKHVFMLEHKNMRTYTLAADTYKTMLRWIYALNMACLVESPRSAINSDPDSIRTFRNVQDAPQILTGHDYDPYDERYVQSPTISHRTTHSNATESSNSFVAGVGQPVYVNAPPKPRRQTFDATEMNVEHNGRGYGVNYGSSYTANDLDYSANYYNTNHNYKSNTQSNQLMNHHYAISHQNQQAEAQYPIDIYQNTSGKSVELVPNYNLRMNAVPSERRTPDAYGRSVGFYVRNGDYEDITGIRTSGSLTNAQPQSPGYLHDVQRIENIVRPHSVDFFEQDLKDNRVVRTNRPKSSLAIHNDPDNDLFYSEKDYANQMRQSVVYLQSLRQNQSFNRTTKIRNNVSPINGDVMNSPANGQMYYGSSYQQQQQHQMQRQQQMQQQMQQEQRAFNDKKREESMKRLIEWKQRMLQSPLNQKMGKYPRIGAETPTDYVVNDRNESNDQNPNQIETELNVADAGSPDVDNNIEVQNVLMEVQITDETDVANKNIPNRLSDDDRCDESSGQITDAFDAVECGLSEVPEKTALGLSEKNLNTVKSRKFGPSGNIWTDSFDKITEVTCVTDGFVDAVECGSSDALEKFGMRLSQKNHNTGNSRNLGQSGNIWTDSFDEMTEVTDATGAFAYPVECGSTEVPEKGGFRLPQKNLNLANLRKFGPSGNIWTDSFDEMTEVNVNEDDYIIMTAKSSSVKPPAKLDVDNSYVEMFRNNQCSGGLVENDPAEYHTDKTYELLRIDAPIQEPEYIELTPKRTKAEKMPDILMLPDDKTDVKKNDGSDADDEASKEFSSFDSACMDGRDQIKPSESGFDSSKDGFQPDNKSEGSLLETDDLIDLSLHGLMNLSGELSGHNMQPRFSLSDTFRPASYYLGAGVCSNRLMSEYHDSSDSELVSPPSIPAGSPSFDDDDENKRSESPDQFRQINDVSYGSDLKLTVDNLSKINNNNHYYMDNLRKYDFIESSFDKNLLSPVISSKLNAQIEKADLLHAVMTDRNDVINWTDRSERSDGKTFERSKSQDILDEADKLWEEDGLWRENLRKASHRHARSLDDLQTAQQLIAYKAKTKDYANLKTIEYVRNFENSSKINAKNHHDHSWSSQMRYNQFLIDREKLRQWDLMSSAPNDARMNHSRMNNHILNSSVSHDGYHPAHDRSRSHHDSYSYSTPRNHKLHNVQRSNDYGNNNSNQSNQNSKTNISAGDLLGRTHEELILLLIQLRRQSVMIYQAIEMCYVDMKSLCSKIAYGGVTDKAEYVFQLEELKSNLMMLGKQYEKNKPLINLVDNMVKLGSLYKRNNNNSDKFYQIDTGDRLRFNQKIQEQRLLQEEQKEWKRMDIDFDNFQDKMKKLLELDNVLKEESSNLAKLRQEKQFLESALNSIQSKLNTAITPMTPPYELEKIRQQQKLLEEELNRIHLLFAFNSRKLEETVAGNVRIEQELSVLRQKLYNSHQPAKIEYPNRDDRNADTPHLETDLRRVQQLVGNLQKQRRELSAQVRSFREKSTKDAICKRSHSHTNSNASWQSDKTLTKWQETDLDSTMNQTNYSEDSQTDDLYTSSSSLTNHLTGALNHLNLSMPKGESTPYDGSATTEKSEIKTVRIVKRESERRHRDRSGSASTSFDDSSTTSPVDVYLSDKNESELPNNRRAIPKEKRRHYTAPSSSLWDVNSDTTTYQSTGDNSTWTINDRSRDDLDMERALRSRLTTPDVVKSTMNKQEYKFNERTIDNILGTPNKIVIPERYVPVNEDAVELSVEEETKRLKKIESIKKMLSDYTAVSSFLNDANTSDDVKARQHTVTEEKKQREHLLQLNQILAKQVMEMSKIVAGSKAKPDTS